MMRYPGWILFCLGLTSFGVNLVDFEIAAMMWVDNWGSGVGNGIRGGMIAVGALLVYLSRRGESQQPRQEMPAAEVADS